MFSAVLSMCPFSSVQRLSRCRDSGGLSPRNCKEGKGFHLKGVKRHSKFSNCTGGLQPSTLIRGQEGKGRLREGGRMKDQRGRQYNRICIPLRITSEFLCTSVFWL